MWDRQVGRPIIGPWRESVETATADRDRVRVELREGRASAEKGPTLGQAITTFLDGAQDGTILNRSGRPYKPSMVRSLRTDLNRLRETLGPALRLSELHLTLMQGYVDERSAKGAAPSTVCGDVASARALYAWARRRHRVLQARDPFQGLLLPRGERARDRIASPQEMALLVAALDLPDRARLAVAGYAGLRRGEILALSREHIDLEQRLISVERAWDVGAREFIPPKSAAAVRVVPIVRRLLVILEDHLAGLEGDLLFPGRDPRVPEDPKAWARRARKRWEKIGLDRIGLHEARHSFASLCISAGVNAKTLCTFMGHSSIVVTFDRYGHLMPGAENEALELMDTRLERA